VLLDVVYTPRAQTETGVSDRGASQDRNTYLQVTAGKTLVDRFEMSNQSGIALRVSYGLPIQRPIALEISFLDQQVHEVMQREGLAAQIVAQHEFSTAHIQVLAGAGPKLAKTSDEALHLTSTRADLLLSYGLRVPIGQRMSIVLRLGRIESASKRNDTDLVTGAFTINL